MNVEQFADAISRDGGVSKATAYSIYCHADGDATKALYTWLDRQGPAGQIALNLFRAHKSSNRAKEYRNSFTPVAYQKKEWSLENACVLLKQHGDALGIRWGWLRDPEQPRHSWVLYVDLPTGQVSFHTRQCLIGPYYSGEWDGVIKAGEFRICAYIATLSGFPAEVVKGQRREPLPQQALLL